MKILVTGATGFVGRTLVPLLAERGHEVRAAVRRPDATVPGAATAAVGEIGPDTDWAAALRGAEAVVHLAARVHVMRDRAKDPLAAFRQVNTEGTRRLAEAAAAAGVRRFVLVSSIKAVTDESRPAPVAERDTPRPGSPYGISKLEAEQALAAVGSRTGMETVVLRPPLVYGPGVGGNFRTLMELIRRRVPLPVGKVENRRSLLFVENLADAIALALVHPDAAGHAFLLHDSFPMSTPDLVRGLAREMGVKPRLIAVSPDLLRLGARLAGKRAAYDRVAGSLVVEDHLIHRTLLWRPPRNTAYGLRATAEWFKSCRG
ncbi:NAD-dependent epimerase/dehydratase family protein [Azospirillum halopraeferens]|uniref:NAD-dependent epimerase/dehydratase family protein n=1 Tax=Azospirillum halopraeferens TaxID=34010 RepID=UPI0004238846|nr:NAD-dependent epimerase/dehydratase family protein [Azospirillum halopraeferens]